MYHRSIYELHPRLQTLLFVDASIVAVAASIITINTALIPTTILKTQRLKQCST